MNRRLERVNVASLRVALISTGLVAVVYAIVAVMVVVFVTNNLTAQVDAKLAKTMAYYEAHTSRIATRSMGGRPRPGRARFADALLVLLPARRAALRRDPDQQRQRTGRRCPARRCRRDRRDHHDRCRGSSPIVGSWRAIHVGRPGPSDRRSYNVDSISQARSSLIVTETVAGLRRPAARLLRHRCSSAVGSARPIELARQRQLEFTADASHELRTPLGRDRGANQSRAQPGSRSRLVPERLPAHRVRKRPNSPPRGRPALAGACRHAPGSSERRSRWNWASSCPRPPSASRPSPRAAGSRSRCPIGMGPLVVMGSSEWLDRLLGVLLDNACKYAPKGGVVGVSVGADGNRVRLVVDDSGPGIPEDERSKIFDRFHRAMDQGYGSGPRTGDRGCGRAAHPRSLGSDHLTARRR